MSVADKKYKKEKILSFTTAGIDSELHTQIRAEAARNKQSFSAQIREWYNRLLDTQEKLDEARTEIKMLKERSNN